MRQSAFTDKLPDDDLTQAPFAQVCVFSEDQEQSHVGRTSSAQDENSR